MAGGLAGEFGTLPVLGGGMTQLIFFRAMQGLGGGALFTTAFAIIAELYPPRERAKFSGLFGSIFGLASVFGPVIGGFFTDHGTVVLFGHVVAGWRWVFYVNVPFALRRRGDDPDQDADRAAQGPGRIDWLGAGLLVTGFVPLLLAVTWGGREYAWDLAAMVLGLFALALRRWPPSSSWSGGCATRSCRSTCSATAPSRPPTRASFVYSMAFMGTSAFLPLFMQVGQGVAATNSGFTMLPLMVGMIASSTLSGQLVTRTGRYKPFMIGRRRRAAGRRGLALTFIGPDTSTLDLAVAAVAGGRRPRARPEPVQPGGPERRAAAPAGRGDQLRRSSSARSARPWAWRFSGRC